MEEEDGVEEEEDGVKEEDGIEEQEEEGELLLVLGMKLGTGHWTYLPILIRPRKNHQI